MSIFRSFVLADLITLANASCGMAAIFLCLNHAAGFHTSHLWSVFLLLPLALVCDFLDGFIARRLARHSALGADLDSLADIVSFGVAPAVLGFTLGLRGTWDAFILIYFVVCGISRLARFNVTAAALSGPAGKVKYYEGTPIPTSIVVVIILGIAFWQGRIDHLIPLGSYRVGPWIFHPLTILYAVSGTMMISSFRVPKP
ncbi:MAG TPA: CDP-diacylglycerol--serine O-phosphatidyltransferase [Thermodesulfobacteriota bacterium]|nr:CDP-diacylglycerol--serine O-phosphatidyltransferase [Thermodesulfobacteriota bacterium]